MPTATARIASDRACAGARSRSPRAACISAAGRPFSLSCVAGRITASMQRWLRRVMPR
ncbi:hypothetical protein ROTAS13_04695 [Roseomonas sp. TAS13]|nr:hypothetical protein ROTAS13_04695 [Roseomonas sp. TAS13]